MISLVIPRHLLCACIVALLAPFLCVEAADLDPSKQDLPDSHNSSTGNDLNVGAIQFDRDIRPILSDKCFFCHGPDAEHREADLRLDLETAARSVIVPGDPDASELVLRIESDDPDAVMPPPDSNKTLTKQEVAALSQWVQSGAKWSQHWAFVPPQPVPVPKVDQAMDNPIDAFVIERLNRLGMSMSHRADPAKLLRRITYDLTGAPPTLNELDEFLSDPTDKAYRDVVDRLINSPRYGQRMALAWLDAARYGDTSVYHADGPRDMWAWRDAVVDAYNQNMPFDEFTISQLAGDLLPNATLQQQILAGFNRNNGTTDEGGAFAEEYRVEYAVDRVKTTSTVWLGLTMECAQCHDHKYDPISQQDYYRFFAFFNVSRDAGMQTRRGNAQPVVEIPDPERQKALPATHARADQVAARIKAIESECTDELQSWIDRVRADDDAMGMPTGAIVDMPLLKGKGNQPLDHARPDQSIVFQGNPKWVESRYDWALQFAGNAHVDLGNVADFERSDAFSYGGWVNLDKGAGQGALLARMDDANAHRGFDLYVGPNGVAVHLIHRWPDNAIKVNTKKKLGADRWRHVFATYDGSGKAAGIKIYVDGEIWDWKIEQDGLTDTIRTDKSLLIGSRHGGSKLKGSVDQVAVFDRQLDAQEVARVANAIPIRALLALDAESITEKQRAAIRRYYLTTQHDEYQKLSAESQELDARIAELKKPLTTVMVMGDMEKPRETFILTRGAYDSPSDVKVTAGTPSALPPLAEGLPGDRLGLARWLFQPDHPLTARVAVNRIWQMFFGRGLVETAEDFGSQGTFPSHPELLDWLATDFQEHGWDVKRLIKQIVTSRAYQQTSQATPQAYANDPHNALLARGPRFRLQGEFIRDTALELGGLLINSYGGPGVKPYQPPGLWAEVGLGGNPKFVQDHNDKLYRRSLYTYWKRSAPPPSMQIFDAPTREKCTIRRARTNTPLQALVTLNDIQFVEAARHFARRIMIDGGVDTSDRIEFGFRLATARRPNQLEQQVLQRILSDALSHYQKHRDDAEKLLATGESPRASDLDSSEHAAWTIVASSLLNLDETLSRE